MDRTSCWKVAKSWAYILLWLQNKICATNFDFRGIENIPTNQNLIVAGKHQSAWETYTLLLFFKNPNYIFKRSLLKIPLFGWFAIKLKTVPVDRAKGSVALASMIENITKAFKREHTQIIIYPEGTRKISGAPPKYKYGITHLYLKMQVPVLPVALNSGLFWGRETFLRYPGTIVIDFMKPIQPGLAKDTFTKKLQKMIEDKTLQQNKETANSKNPPPLAKQFL